MIQKLIKYLAFIFGLFLMGISVYAHNNLPPSTDKNTIILFVLGFMMFVISFYSILKHPNDET